MTQKTITVVPPGFPGEEAIAYWVVVHADGGGQDEDGRDLHRNK